jgi:hypothetical protein
MASKLILKAKEMKREASNKPGTDPDNWGATSKIVANATLDVIPPDTGAGTIELTRLNLANYSAKRPSGAELQLAQLDDDSALSMAVKTLKDLTGISSKYASLILLAKPKSADALRGLTNIVPRKVLVKVLARIKSIKKIVIEGSNVKSRYKWV